jgi:drug/metabolite transporter (DMT)-like permease
VTAVANAPLILALRGRSAVVALARAWRRGLSGGLAAFVGYAVVVWAMTRAPIGVVAALRETSVLFAALIGVTLLGEPFRPQRAAAALVIVLGVLALRLQ